MNLSRRKFVQGALLGGAALGAVGITQSGRAVPPLPPMADLSGLTPPLASLKSQPLALGSFFPSLLDPDAREVPFITNTLASMEPSARFSRQGEPGNSVFVGHAD